MNKKLSKVLITSASTLALLAAYPQIAGKVEEAGFDSPIVTVKAANATVADFVNESIAIPNVSEIERMDAVDLADTVRDIKSARATYESLSNADKNHSSAQKWVGYLQQKEDSLVKESILLAIDLPFVDRVRDLTGIRLDNAEAEIDAVRELFDVLPAEAQAHPSVIKWAGYLTQKEDAVSVRRFVEFSIDLPDNVEIAEMDAIELAEAAEAIAEAQEMHEALRDSAKEHESAIKWAGYLEDKEAAVAERANELADDELEVVSVRAISNRDKSVSITGNVRNADRVTITIDGVERTAELANNGSFTFTSPALSVGTYEVTVTAFAGDDSTSATVQAAVVDEDTSIAGFVLYGNDDPVPGATVTVAGEEYTTDSNGFYQVRGLATDRFYDLTVTRPEHETQTERVRVTGDKVSSVITENFKQIVRKDIAIEGNVVDSVTGKNVAGTLNFQAYSDELSEWVTIHTENHEGAYSVKQNDEGITPGDFLEFGEDYRLVLEAEGYHSQEVDVTVNDKRQVTELPAVQLAQIQNTRISGNVTRDGSAVEAADVKLVGFPGITAKTNANGSYDFGNHRLPSGTYNLAVTYTTGAGDSTVTTRSITVQEGTNLANQNIELALGAEVELLLSAPAAKAFVVSDSITATVFNSDGVAVADSEAVQQLDSTRAYFKFANNLPAGQYTVVVEGNYVVPTEYGFEVTAADVAAYVDADTPEAKTISGNDYIAVLGGQVTGLANSVEVTNPDVVDGDILTRDTVIVLSNASGEAYRAVVGQDDTLSGVVPGTYSVEIFKPGYQFNKASSKKTSITVGENANVAYSKGDLDLVVPTQTASIQGLVRDANSLSVIKDATVSLYQGGSLVGKYTQTDYAAGINVNPGIYTVVVRDSGEYVTHVEQITLNNKDNISNRHFNLEAGSAQIDVSVVDGANRAYAADTITVYDAWADRSAGAYDAGATRVTKSDSKLFRNLSTGEFDIVVTRDGHNTQTIGVSLANNQDFRTTVVLSEVDATYAATVNVVEEGTASAFNGTGNVVVFDQAGNVVRVGTLANGSATFDLANGSYVVQTYVDGYYVASEDITIDREAVTTLLEIQEGDWDVNVTP